jgi:calcineurin-like phosphoesterase family protein
VRGNHDDWRLISGFTCFASVQERAQTRVNGNTIILDHYAGRAWNKSHHGSYLFYGHSHGGMPPFGRSLDVGVDCWDYRPVTFDQCVARLKEVGEHDRFVDHHVREQP